MARTAIPIVLLVTCFCAAALRAQVSAAVPAGPRAQGLKVTYAPQESERRDKEGVFSYRARVLSLCVERGETPTPALAPGMFEATFRGLVVLPVRDRYRFRVEGKGSFELGINGERVLSGTLRPGRPEETAQPVRLQKGDNEVVVRIESGAAGDVQLRLYWSSSEFAFEPIRPEVWSWPTGDPDIAVGEQLRRGQQLFAERRCARCHELPDRAAAAYGEAVEPAPDLRAVGQRLQPAFLLEWLTDPRAVRPDATMPTFGLSATELRDVVAWLAGLGQPVASAPFAADAAARGRTRFKELGCVACHLPPDVATADDAVRGRMSLAHVARKWWPAALQQYLLAPARDYEHTRMPDFRLEAADAADLAAYLVDGAPAPAAVPSGDADAGRRLAQRHGCDRCHALQLPESGRHFQGLVALHHDHGCLADGDREQAPDFGLAKDDLLALRAYLPHAPRTLGNRSPLDFAARMVPALRCTACHGLDGTASVWAQVTAEQSKAAPLPKEQDPVAQGVPALTWVGSKLQPSWMERFVTGRERSPRPWLRARMPTFAAHGPIVVAGLARMHGYPSVDEPEAAPDPQLAAAGARLVKVGEGFGCVQCHAVGATPAVAVFEREGINFAVAAVRLRHEYYLRWLLDPLRIDPDSRMPKFADDKGRTAFKEVLDGDARRQFEAIWSWFRTLK